MLGKILTASRRSEKEGGNSRLFRNGEGGDHPVEKFRSKVRGLGNSRRTPKEATYERFGPKKASEEEELLHMHTAQRKKRRFLQSWRKHGKSSSGEGAKDPPKERLTKEKNKGMMEKKKSGLISRHSGKKNRKRGSTTMYKGGGHGFHFGHVVRHLHNPLSKRGRGTGEKTLQSTKQKKRERV